MNRLLFKLACGVVVAACVASCSKSEKEGAEAPAQHVLVTNANDSTEVVALVNEFMGHIVNGDAAAAIDMLGNTEHDSISSYDGLPLDLPSEVKEKYVDVYKNWKVDGYEIVNLEFSDYRDNQVRVRAHMADGTTRSMNFNPIRGITGWRLTMRDTTRGTSAYSGN